MSENIGSLWPNEEDFPPEEVFNKWANTYPDEFEKLKQIIDKVTEAKAELEVYEQALLAQCQKFKLETRFLMGNL